VRKRDQREEGPRAGDFEVAEGQHTRLLDGEFAGFPTIEYLGGIRAGAAKAVEGSDE
jgi:hypothetical protein